MPLRGSQVLSPTGIKRWISSPVVNAGEAQASPRRDNKDLTRPGPRVAQQLEGRRVRERGSPGVRREGHRQFFNRLFNRSENRLQRKSWPAGRWRPKNWFSVFGG